MPLVLVIPHLLVPPDAPEAVRGLRLPALERALSRADASRSPDAGLHAVLAAEYALGASPAIAAISMAGEDEPRGGAWLRADPVHLQLAQDGVVLQDAATLAIGHDEAVAMSAALDHHFHADGLAFHAAAPERWYLRVPQGEMPRTTPLTDAVGRNVFGLLPRGSGRINWAAAITEAQMVLSNHEANARREAEDRPAVNSVWFWGEGTMPVAVPKAFAAVHAQEPFARGLGRMSGARTSGLAPTLAAVDAGTPGEAVLVVDDSLSGPFLRGDVEAWRARADGLERDWFAPLVAELGRFATARIVLPAQGGARCFALSPGSARWRILRVRKPLASHG